MDRRTQRDTAYKLVFEMLVINNTEPYTLEIIAEDEGQIPEYVMIVFGGVVERLDELSMLIDSHAGEFRGKLFAPDKAALLLAAYEILYMDDIPKAVSINEAVELVKMYSTPKSAAFVNGILAKIG